MMKFYMTPGSCSTGIHILLEELDLMFEVHLVDLMAGDQRSEGFLAINPKGTIPVLVREDGTPVTEFQAIAWWLARQYPGASLLPEGLEAEVRAMELMNYIVGTIHMQGFTRIFTTDSYTVSEEDVPRIKAQGEAMVAAGFKVIDQMLGDFGYLLESFSIADAALFYVEFWAKRIDLPLPPNCEAHYQLMLTRPKVQQVLREEGYQVR